MFDGWSGDLGQFDLGKFDFGQFELDFGDFELGQVDLGQLWRLGRRGRRPFRGCRRRWRRHDRLGKFHFREFYFWKLKCKSSLVGLDLANRLRRRWELGRFGNVTLGSFSFEQGGDLFLQLVQLLPRKRHNFVNGVHDFLLGFFNGPIDSLLGGIDDPSRRGFDLVRYFFGQFDGSIGHLLRNLFDLLGSLLDLALCGGLHFDRDGFDFGHSLVGLSLGCCGDLIRDGRDARHDTSHGVFCGSHNALP